MTSNIQFVSELAGLIPVASAPGKVRLFRDVSDGLLKFKDHTGAVFPIAGTQDYKDAVRFATAAALPAYTRVGNQITANANGVLPAIDGVTPVLNDSFLLLNGASDIDNGIWVVTQVGSGALPYILDRRGDFTTSSQVSAGLVVPTGPEGASNGKKLFILVTPDPIVLNSSAIEFEAISGGGGFTITVLNEDTTIPEAQAMLYHDDVLVEDGDLNVEGDVTPVRTEDNFSVNFIPARSVRVVQENDQMLFTDSLQIDGDLIVDGDIIDATPYDGFDILAALTAIAPSTPSILGVSSPASFLTPAQARTVMDVPSTGDVTAQIAAATENNLFNLEFEAKSVDFTAVPGKVYGITATADEITLPENPADGDTVAFFSIADTAVPTEIESFAGEDVTDGITTDVEYAATITSQLLYFRWIASSNYWRVFGLTPASSGTGVTLFDATGVTASNETTTLTTYVVPGVDTSVVAFELLVQGIAPSVTNSALFSIAAIAYDNAGTVTVDDLTFVNGPYRGAAISTCTVSLGVSGLNINIEVTGETGTPISWRVTGKAVLSS